MSKNCCHLQYLQTRCRDSGDNMLQNLLKYAVIYKQKNTQKNSKHHDHCLTSCIKVRIMTGLFFFIISNVSQEGVVGQHALMSTPLLLLPKQWMPWMRRLITGLGDCQEYSSSIWSGVGWLPPQFHLTKQLKAFVSALQVYHKSCRFSLVQFSSTAQREKPTIS